MNIARNPVKFSNAKLKKNVGLITLKKYQTF